MGRLLAIFAGCCALLLVPLSLSTPTAWLVVAPMHLLLVLLTCTGAGLAGLAGRPVVVRRWGHFYLLATLVAIGALELGGRLAPPRLMGAVRPGLHWSGAWCLGLLWGWIPPVICLGMAEVGEHISLRRSRRVRRRRRVRAEPR